MTLAQSPETPLILQTVSLLTAYCFDLRGLAPMQVIETWVGKFSVLWIRLAVIEALYLGRYKAISVEHLLQFWQSKGQPCFHFSPEFERMVSQKLPKSLVPMPLEMPPVSLMAVNPGQAPSVALPPSDAVASPAPTSSLPANRNTPTPSPDHGHPSHPTANGQGSRKFTPSIEQFIPLAVESDLLTKLQSVLSQSHSEIKTGVKTGIKEASSQA